MMAEIGKAYRELLDRSMPKPVIGKGYLVEVRSRDGVRYREQGRTITMFSDLIEGTTEPVNGGFLSWVKSKLTSKWCLGVYMEEPLRWDDDNVTEISMDHQVEIFERVQAALRERTNCFRIERGPNRQGSGWQAGSNQNDWKPLRWG